MGLITTEILKEKNPNSTKGPGELTSSKKTWDSHAKDNGSLKPDLKGWEFKGAKTKPLG